MLKKMLEQEAQREAQEKAKHDAMLEMLKKEADMRYINELVLILNIKVSIYCLVSNFYTDNRCCCKRER